MKISKKSELYSSLFFLIFVAIASSVLYITYSSPLETQSSELDFGSISSNTQKEVLELDVLKVYLDSEVRTTLNKEMELFLGKYLSRIYDFDCEEDGIILLYDERRNEQCSIEDMSDFREQFIKEFSSSLSRTINEHHSDLEVSISQGESSLLIQFKKKKLLSSQHYSVELDFNHERSVDISNYFQTVESVHKAVFEFPAQLNREFYSCVKKEGNSVKSCEVSLFKESLILNELNSLDMKTLEDLDEDYFGYSGEISHNQDYTLTFGFILKNLPFDFVDFSLSTINYANNVVKVNLDSENQDTATYLILYSYSNFLDESSYPKYEELLRTLEEGTLIQKLSSQKQCQLPAQPSSGKYLCLDEGFNLNAYVLSSQEFKDKGAPIYQSYSFDTAKIGVFEPLESKELFVAVFAYDDSDPRFITDKVGLENHIKSITPKKFLGPRPFISNNEKGQINEVSVSGLVLDSESSIIVDIHSYDDDISFLDVKVSSLENPDLENCNAAQECYSSRISLTQDIKESSILITSLDDTSDLDPHTYVLKTQEDFQAAYTLENEKSYTVALIPVNSEGLSISKTTLVGTLVHDATKRHYTFIEDGAPLVPAQFRVLVEDNVEPDPLTAIRDDISMNSDGSVNWGIPLGGEEIEYLDALTPLNEYFIIKKDGLIYRFGSEEAYDLTQVSSLTLSTIIPVPLSGPYHEVHSYSGETYALEYTNPQALSE